MTKFHRSFWMISTLLAVCFLLAACGPEKTIQWSPDGRQAAIVSGGKLYVCDDRGNLSAPLAEGVERVAWLPDSSRLVMVSTREVDTWPGLVKASPLNFDEKKIIASAMAVRDELYGFGDDLEKFKPAHAEALTFEQWMAAWLYLKEQGDPRFMAKLGDKGKDAESMKIDVRTVRLIQVSPGEVTDETILFTTMEDIDDLRVSPDGGMLAFVTRWRKGWHESEMRSLSVVPATAGSKPAVVADQVSRFPDWSPDGRSLMYVQSEGVDADDDALGQIRRRAIRDSKGAILGEFAGAENLATVVFRGTLKVRCLLDGRVLFTAKAVSLPVLSRDMPNGSTLFILNPGQPGSISRAFSISVDQKLPDALDLFELSPDEKHIAVPGSKGRVSVIAMATGEITPVIDKDGTGELLAIPVWRNSNQLSLVVPAGSVYGSPKREEFVLWSPDKTVVISHGWPDEVISGIK